MLTRPLLAFLLLAGCGPGDPTLELGIGEGRFATFEDNQTLDLVRGCQGAQHVWTALRATGLDPRGTIIDLSMRRAADDVVVSQAFVVRVSLDPVGGEDGVAEVYGLQLVVPEPDQAIGQDLFMRATVTDRAGVEVFDERPMRVDWGDGGCL